MKPTKYIFLTLLVLLQIACTPEEIIEAPLLDLSFSLSPIDLKSIDAQYVSDLAYDDFEQTKLDLYLPVSSEPTALVIFIHSGGFKGGDKNFIYRDDYSPKVLELLSHNIAVASINYRLLEENETTGILKSLHDSKRALQFMRYYHKSFNIDKENISLFGSSAGGGTALWLATCDDMIDKDNSDPVLRVSSRVKSIAINGAQASYDFDRYISDIFTDFNVDHDSVLEVLAQGENSVLYYGGIPYEDYNSPEIIEYREQVDMLSHISPDDPPIWSQSVTSKNSFPEYLGAWLHHPFHTREIKRQADAAGVENVCIYGDPIIYADPSDEDYISFLIRMAKR